MNLLHYVLFGPPDSTGYTIRTKSIVETQKKQGLSPYVAISFYHTLNNCLNEKTTTTQFKNNGIDYYSPLNQLINDFHFKFFKKFMKIDSKFSNKFKREFYSFKKKKIISGYEKFLLDELKNIDLIHSHTPSVAFEEAFLLNQRLNSKIIYEVRGFWNLSLEDTSQDVLKSISSDIAVCKAADRCIAICNGIADILVKGGIPASKIDIVPNGVDPSKFKIVEKDKRLLTEMNLDGKIVFGYFTNVRKLEGVQTIVKAWNYIKKELPNAVFLLLGSGSYLSEIKEMIKQLSIEDSFFLLGRVPHHKIASYYSLLDIFVVPRINIPVSNIVSPLKPLEAMINRKSLIVSDVGALKEMVINGETGLFFKADDHIDLANKCIDLAKNDKLRAEIGKNARAWVLKNRTWDKVVYGYSQIYDKVV